MKSDGYTGEDEYTASKAVKGEKVLPFTALVV